MRSGTPRPTYRWRSCTSWACWERRRIRNLNFAPGTVPIVDNGDGTAALNNVVFDANGQLIFLVGNTVAEGPVTIGVSEPVSGISGDTTTSSTDVTWQPGALQNFLVEADPTDLKAGETTSLTITARDTFNNAVGSHTGDVEIVQTGSGTGAGLTYSPIVIDNGDGTATLTNVTFDPNGQLSIFVTNTHAEGPLRFTATDPVSGATGDTGDTGTDVTWRVGVLENFLVEADPVIVAIGDATTLTVTARDQFDNAIPLASPGADGILVTQPFGSLTVVYEPGTLTIVDNNDGTGLIPSGTIFDAAGRGSVRVRNSVAEGPIPFIVTDIFSGAIGGTVDPVVWADVTPPTVTITAPAPGSQFILGQQLTVEANATDDVGVERVDFSIDGAVQVTDTTFPYTGDFTPSLGAHTFHARSFDAAGNNTLSTPLVLNVVADQPPSVSIVSPVAGAQVVEGDTLLVEASAQDDVAVLRVELSVNGVLQTDTSAPYIFNLTAPPAIDGPIRLIATAVDSGNQSTSTSELAVGVLPRVHLEFPAPTSDAGESGGPHVVDVRLRTSVALLVLIGASVVDAGGGTAASGADYTGFGTQNVVFPAGSIDGDTQSVTLDVLDDLLVEGSETANLRIDAASGAGAFVGAADTHTVRILDDEFVTTIASTATPTRSPAAPIRSHYSASQSLAGPSDSPRWSTLASAIPATSPTCTLAARPLAPSSIHKASA